MLQQAMVQQGPVRAGLAVSASTDLVSSRAPLGSVVQATAGGQRQQQRSFSHASSPQNAPGVSTSNTSTTSNNSSSLHMACCPALPGVSRVICLGPVLAHVFHSSSPCGVQPSSTRCHTTQLDWSRCRPTLQTAPHHLLHSCQLTGLCSSSTASVDQRRGLCWGPLQQVPASHPAQSRLRLPAHHTAAWALQWRQALSPGTAAAPAPLHKAPHALSNSMVYQPWARQSPAPPLLLQLRVSTGTLSSSSKGLQAMVSCCLLR